MNRHDSIYDCIYSIWVFPKIGVDPPKSSILIGFSILCSIHFVFFPPIFWMKLHAKGGCYMQKVDEVSAEKFLENKPLIKNGYPPVN